ncbi:hypothetical protein Lalb_Chr25g0282541 [Lupinus albus]|uniref:Uncharacterized protein n=1 Tax=Lupinus albus TaxID=3870 RepID=A0A6A4MKP8_LUPAL|nr:hypothetical protein Lalb_Chr25g0282541 [Lupinus albus]
MYWRLKGDVLGTYKWFQVLEGLLEKIIDLLLMISMEIWRNKVNTIEA